MPNNKKRKASSELKSQTKKQQSVNSTEDRNMSGEKALKGKVDSFEAQLKKLESELTNRITNAEKKLVAQEKAIAFRDDELEDLKKIMLI